MKAAVLFSGGKDSCYSAYLARKKNYELSCLISVFSKNKESYMFHTPSISKVKKQAKVMEIPLLIKTTKGKKEDELKDLEKIILKAKKKFGIDTIVTGAIKSVYQKSRIQKICDKLNLKCFNPLWNKDEFEYLNELFNNNFEVMIVGVASEGLEKKWLGKIIDKKDFNELKKLKTKFKFHLAFEGGEAETFITDCPLFKKKIKVINGRTIWDGFSGRYSINKVKLINK